MTIFRLALLLFLFHVVADMTALASYNSNNYDVPDTQAERTDQFTNTSELGDDVGNDDSQQGSYKGSDSNAEDQTNVLDKVHITHATWEEMKPKLEQLIEETIANPYYEERYLEMNFTEIEFKKFLPWLCEECDKKYPSHYPISISSNGLTYKGPDKSLTRTEIIIISNYTLREARSRQTEAYETYRKHKSSTKKEYNFLPDNLDPSSYNEVTFHNLMVRGNLTKEELDRGGHDLPVQSPVDVLPISLTNIELILAAKELATLIDSSLRNSMKPVVVLIFNLPRDAKYNPGQLYNQRSQACNSSLQLELFRGPAIVEPSENRIYLFLRNKLRKVLDLHGLKPKEARERVIEFIYDKYNSFESKFQIMTGKGNHSANQHSVLKAKLPIWLEETRVKDLIKSKMPSKENPGLFDICLLEPICAKSPFLEDLPFHLRSMILCGSIKAVRPSLYKEGWILNIGEDLQVSPQDAIAVRLQDDEKYFKLKKQPQQPKKTGKKKPSGASGEK